MRIGSCAHYQPHALSFPANIELFFKIGYTLYTGFTAGEELYSTVYIDFTPHSRAIGRILEQPVLKTKSA